MSSDQFIYWLQGHLELRVNQNCGLSPVQVDIIKDHLNLVFDKLTPDRGGEIPSPTSTAGELLNAERWTNVTQRLYC